METGRMYNGERLHSDEEWEESKPKLLLPRHEWVNGFIILNTVIDFLYWNSLKKTDCKDLPDVDM
jgi:hypothetical protein